MKGWRLAIACALATGAGAQIDADEHPRLESSSPAFRQSVDSSLQAMDRAGLTDRMEAPSLGSVSSDRFNALRTAIKAETPVSGVSEGVAGSTYDIILQPGHYGRTTGRVGTAGQYVSERALVAYIVNRTAVRLRQSGLRVLVISADRYIHGNAQSADFNGLKGKVFLAVHADGSTRPCATGPSLAYKGNDSLLAMHAVGFALSTALGYDYKDFNRDNFTVDEAHYYMFNQVRAPRLVGLLEVGELTCPASEKNLIGSADIIGTNLAQALQFIAALPSS